MIRCLTNHKAFSLVELMMAVAFSVLLMIGVYGFYNVASQSYFSGISGQTLQDGANIIISKIIEGETESNGVYRLATAVSYMIPNGNVSELYYCQDSPCTSNDTTARWYYLSNDSTSVIYHHPVSGGTVDETIYTAPTGSTLTLRFSPAAVGLPLNVVEIDVALITNLAANITNQKLATTGAASTFVLLRNHL